MIIRNGFVSNSSSSSFMITNKTNKELDLITFVAENGEQLVKDFVERFDWYSADDYNFKKLMASAESNNETIIPGSQEMIFGDEDGSMIGAIFDYMLRDGGESKSFEWKFHESLR